MTFASRPRDRARRRSPALVLALAVLTLAASGCTRRATETTTDAGRMGTARLYVPRARDGSVVVLFSGAHGFDRALESAAWRLAESGVIVAGIDLPAYLAKLSTEAGCAYVVGDVEELAHRLEREQGLARYRLPVLAGVGEGATLAYAALAQAPAATVAGAPGQIGPFVTSVGAGSMPTAPATVAAGACASAAYASVAPSPTPASTGRR